MPETLIYPSHSEQDTQLLGQQLAEAIDSGTVFALNGELGSGKTNLVRATCRGLGIDDLQVNSPTFVLMQSYTDGRVPVVHFDTYRLADIDEFLAIGGEDYLLDAELVCFVEWAERIGEILPADYIKVDICQTGEANREFTFSATGQKSAAVIGRLTAALQASAHQKGRN